MKVIVLGEAGWEPALFGIGLSYGITSGMSFQEFCQSPETLNRLYDIATKLAAKGDSHAKFLESVVVWLDIDAPRYWWQQFDTYRVGVTKQSESTMHTLKSRQLRPSDFSVPIEDILLEMLNTLLLEDSIDLLKGYLPESFLQRRIVCLNYKVLRRIFRQRKSHRLPEWRVFIKSVEEQVCQSEMLWS